MEVATEALQYVLEMYGIGFIAGFLLNGLPEVIGIAVQGIIHIFNRA